MWKTEVTTDKLSELFQENKVAGCNSKTLNFISIYQHKKIRKYNLK